MTLLEGHFNYPDMRFCLSRSKRSAPEIFIGETFNNGKLKIIGIHGIVKKSTLFKLTCEVCSKDKELFPLGYFVMRKGDLIRGREPCGCSKSPKWKDWQYMILARRVGEGKFIVHGFAEEFHGAHTKLKCQCLIDNTIWYTRVSSIISLKTGCPKCAKNVKFTEQEATETCINICRIERYTPLGFPTGYVNAKSIFEYICPAHGKHKVSYTKFVHGGNRCPSCSEYGYNPNKQGSFYLVMWTKGEHSFVKFGVTNGKVISRVKQQASVTDYLYEILYECTFTDGFIPLLMESGLKYSDQFRKGIVSKEEFPDGYTETISMSDIEKFCNY